jgi:hypothetical protein
MRTDHPAEAAKQADAAVGIRHRQLRQGRHVVKNITEAVELLQAERDENTCRKPYTPTECVSIGEANEAMLMPKMKQRQEEGRKASGKKRHSQLQSKLDESRNGQAPQSSQQAAAAVGMSHGSYAKAKVVLRVAKEDPQDARGYNGPGRLG